MNPPNTSPRIAATALGLCLIAATCDAGGRDTTKVDALFKQWDKANSPGAAIVIIKDGSVVYQHGYGSANLEHRIPITPQTVFDVASVAKQFTGLKPRTEKCEGLMKSESSVRQILAGIGDLARDRARRHGHR